MSIKGKFGFMLVGVLIDRFCIDIIGFLLMIFSKNRYILIVIDYFINWVEVFGILD